MNPLETTQGVYQASGYGDIAADKSIFFWYFASRYKPATAPLTLWFNGGPGSSSMYGLFQENGPCRITNDSSAVTLNPWSWNSDSNVLYIDQPVGVGFSHGTMSVNTSIAAAADVWKFMQIFLKDRRFANLVPNKLAIWTESYGGHYGPTFAAYFLQQNAAISAGIITGIHLNLQVLGIGNGMTDPLSQYPGLITYAASNPYHTLVPTSTIISASAEWAAQTSGCRQRIVNCNSPPSADSVCSAAQNVCNGALLGPLAGSWNPDYVISPSGATPVYPPPLSPYLNTIYQQAGAETVWLATNFQVYDNFAATGDWMRTSIHYLETVLDAGIRVTIYDGDADFLCNYIGVEAMLDALNTQTNIADFFHTTAWSLYVVDGHTVGQYKTAGTLSYIRFFGAGHEVPAYSFGAVATGQAAWQMFWQTTVFGVSVYPTFPYQGP
ncbi:alpha/beta-hydrolase [Mycena amicta]|nr:alpha/beta-hydrolase [Mycena amicta]